MRQWALKINRLICRTFGHAKPDGRVAMFYSTTTLKCAWQCPRCLGLVVEVKEVE